LISKILLSGFIGALICAILGFVVFFFLATMDGTKPTEAFGYSLLVGLGCVFIGGMIGLFVGIANLKVIGGAVIGVVATLCIVAFYVFAIGRPGRAAYFLGESKIILIVLSIPTILTGIFTSLLKEWLMTPKP
jgi:hypothetical protein